MVKSNVGITECFQEDLGVNGGKWEVRGAGKVAYFSKIIYDHLLTLVATKLLRKSEDEEVLFWLFSNIILEKGL
jgi:hypothetical protein